MEFTDINQQLRSLRLKGMADRWQSMQEIQQHQQLGFQDGLALLLQAEKDHRQLSRLKRLEKQAGFRYQANLEEIIYQNQRGIRQNQIAALSDGLFVKQGKSILITGATGVGKSFLASAIGHQCCYLGYKVKYFNTQKLMDLLLIKKADGSIFKFMENLAKTDLLIFDDFGMNPFNQQHRMFLMQIIEDRHHQKSTIIASQFPVSKWYDIINDPTFADAILDRLVHDSIRFEISGESLRKKL